MALTTFRDALREISPSWLKRGRAEKFLYAFGVHIDLLGDSLVAGVKSRFPGLYSDDSLPVIGKERRIRRGRNETNEVYATRLLRWLDDHRVRGGHVALLAQLYAHFAPSNFQIDLVYYSGRAFSMDTDGEVTWTDIDWSPDPETARWARWWLFYDWPTSVGDDGLWGDAGTFGDGGVWGSDLTETEVTDLRMVPKEWNAAHALGKVVLLPDGAELWGFPAGTWGDAGVWGGDDPVILEVG